MIRTVFQVTCIVILASVFYDVLRCNRIHKTFTYKYIKHVTSCRSGRFFFRKLRKIKRKLLKNEVWPSSTAPTSSDDTGNELEPYVDYTWSEIKSRAIAVTKEVRLFLSKNFPALEPFVSKASEDIVKWVKASALEASQHIQKYAKKAMEYLAKINL